MSIGACRGSLTPDATTGSKYRNAGAASERAQSFGLSIQAPAADGAPIFVLDAATRLPVDDALVVAVEEWQFHWDHGCSIHDEPDAATELRRMGRAFATGRDGRTRITPANQPLSVFAWKGDRFGTATIGIADRSEKVVELSDRDLSVIVVDSAGMPQPGVPVALARCARSIDLIGAWSGVTGPDGRVRIAAIDLEREACDCHERDESIGGRRVAVTFDFPSCVYERCDLDARRRDDVRLVLPPCGSAEIDVHDESGAPMAESATLMVESSRPPVETNEVESGNETETEPKRPVVGHSIRRRSAEGRFTFTHVELDLRMTTFVEVPHRSFDSVVVTGPKLPNERVTSILAPDGDVVTIHGRALDAMKRPLANADLTGSVLGPKGPEWQNGCRTDGDGRFALTVGAKTFEDDHGTPRRLAFYLVRWDTPIVTTWGNNHVVESGDVDSIGVDGSREIEIGDFVLAPVPLLVRGRVVDQAGAPCFGAVVTARGNGLEGEPWRYTFNYEAITDQNGEFALWSPATPEDTTIAANFGPGWYSKDFNSGEPLVIRPGDDHLVIRLHAETEAEKQEFPR